MPEREIENIEIKKVNFKILEAKYQPADGGREPKQRPDRRVGIDGQR
jgi:hypothetical protein